MSQPLSLLRGQRSKLSDLGLSQGVFTLDLALAPASLALDSACFGLDSQRKLSDERYMTFFNQPQSPCGGVRQTGAGRVRAGRSIMIRPGVDGSGVEGVGVEAPGVARTGVRRSSSSSS